MSLVILLDLFRQEVNYKPMPYGAILRHMDIQYHFIKEQVENGMVELYSTKTEYQQADIFLKLSNGLQKKRKSNGRNSSCMMIPLDNQYPTGRNVYIQDLVDFDAIILAT
ncbi:hypothetical protein Tco_1262004 [Tanacetum coccineum]